MKKVTLELRTGGTVPFAWWVVGKDLELDGQMIPPPQAFTVRAYKNYNDAIVKKHRLPVKITFRKGINTTAIFFRIDGSDEEIMTPPSPNVIPKKKK